MDTPDRPSAFLLYPTQTLSTVAKNPATAGAIARELALRRTDTQNSTINRVAYDIGHMADRVVANQAVLTLVRELLSGWVWRVRGVVFDGIRRFFPVSFVTSLPHFSRSALMELFLHQGLLRTTLTTTTSLHCSSRAGRSSPTPSSTTTYVSSLSLLAHLSYPAAINLIRLLSPSS